MGSYDPKQANDFFFDFDNATLQTFGMVSEEVQKAEGPAFKVAGKFYDLQIDEFEKFANSNAGPLSVIRDLTNELLAKHQMGDFGENLQLAFEDFAQGQLWDDRRNTPKFQYAAVHTMDSIPQRQADEYNAKNILPSEYIPWYGAIRGMSFLPDSNVENWRKFGSYLAVAGAAQNIAKPFCAVWGPDWYKGVRGVAVDPQPPVPWVNPNNQRISPAQLNTFRSEYLNLSFEELDAAFKEAVTSQSGPIWPPADY